MRARPGSKHALTHAASLTQSLPPNRLLQAGAPYTRSAHADRGLPSIELRRLVRCMCGARAKMQAAPLC